MARLGPHVVWGCQCGSVRAVRLRWLAREAELAGMTLGGLRKRAKALGVDAAALEERIDEADDPKAAVVGMILAASGAEPLPGRGAQRPAAPACGAVGGDPTHTHVSPKALTGEAPYAVAQ